ncbi:MarR family winged helix-turn-helix transcriptional regulator [Companilactobacillus furfuricola]|uniref:MarR family winged helix-turn-helix transcriptional regulator n=1 Tax=Companilactobacillus furfuricola TaxID=1462575 RepID=UPI000F79845C|nr:MarR family winged helix-turn-helix transcriptional regulator [Companilactobacillus furfuricola]
MSSNIAHLLKVASNEISRSVNDFASNYDLTGTQVQIIDFLTSVPASEDIFQKDIEAEFNIRRSTATNILKIMEKKELIKRESVESDSRLKKIVVLDKSLRLQHNIDEFMKQNDQRILSNLGAFERRGFLHALQKLPEKLQNTQQSEVNK